MPPVRKMRCVFMRRLYDESDKTLWSPAGTHGKTESAQAHPEGGKGIQEIGEMGIPHSLAWLKEVGRGSGVGPVPELQNSDNLLQLPLLPPCRLPPRRGAFLFLRGGLMIPRSRLAGSEANAHEGGEQGFIRPPY